MLAFRFGGGVRIGLVELLWKPNRFANVNRNLKVEKMELYRTLNKNLAITFIYYNNIYLLSGVFVELANEFAILGSANDVLFLYLNEGPSKNAR